MLWFIFTFYLITGEEAPPPIPSAKLTTGSDVFLFFFCCTAKGMNKKVHVYVFCSYYSNYRDCVHLIKTKGFFFPFLRKKTNLINAQFRGECKRMFCVLIFFIHKKTKWAWMKKKKCWKSWRVGAKETSCSEMTCAPGVYSYTQENSALTLSEFQKLFTVKNNVCGEYKR